LGYEEQGIQLSTILGLRSVNQAELTKLDALDTIHELYGQPIGLSGVTHNLQIQGIRMECSFCLSNKRMPQISQPNTKVRELCRTLVNIFAAIAMHTPCPWIGQDEVLIENEKRKKTDVSFSRFLVIEALGRRERLG
jgi:hypothetical protein